MSATSETNNTTTESDCQRCKKDVKQFIEMLDKRNILFDTAKLNYSVPIDKKHINPLDDINISDVFIEYNTYKMINRWNPFRQTEVVNTGTAKLSLPYCKSIREINDAIRDTYTVYQFQPYFSFGEVKNNYIVKKLFIGLRDLCTRNS